MNRYITVMLRVSWDERKLYDRAARQEFGDAHGALAQWMRSTLAAQCVRQEREAKKRRTKKRVFLSRLSARPRHSR